MMFFSQMITYMMYAWMWMKYDVFLFIEHDEI